MQPLVVAAGHVSEDKIQPDCLDVTLETILKENTWENLSYYFTSIADC